MTAKVIAHMHDRIRRARKIIELAHDREMIAALEQMIEEAQADIERLKAGESKH